MHLKPHIELLATYNQWANEKLYLAASNLDTAALTEDRGAHFGSLQNTLAHLVITDSLWLQRFDRSLRPSAALESLRALQLSDVIESVSLFDFATLWQRRCELDAIVLNWAKELDNADLDKPMHYSTPRGERFDLPALMLILHFFNHQTHHRGQATTLLSQAGIDIAYIDLSELIPHTDVHEQEHDSGHQ